MNITTPRFSIIFVAWFCVTVSGASDSVGAIYKYVDKDGNVQYSNVMPPRSATVVQKTKEVSVQAEVAQERREEKQMLTESSYARARKEEARERREAEKQRAKAEEERRWREQEEKELQQKIRTEKKHILERQKIWLDRCDGLEEGFLIIRECREKVKTRIKKDLRKLRKGGDSYFNHIFSNRRSSEKYFESTLKSYEKKKSSKRDRKYQTK